MLLLIDAALRRHLAAAVAAHVRQLRRDGLPVPAELVRLGAAFSATDGQPRPAVDAPSPGPHPARMDRLALDYREAADVLGISDRAVRRAVKAGDLPAVDVAGARRIRSADLAAYVDGLQPTNTTTTEERPC